MLENSSQIAEFFAALASAGTLLSFLLDGEKAIRKFAIISSVFFIVYGALVPSLSLVVLNVILIGVHSYKLYKLHKSSKYLQARLKTVFTYDNRQIHTISKEEINK